MRLKWFVAVALICGLPAFAGPILLNNTGINGGTPITPGLIDPNWILVGGNYSPFVTTGSPSSAPFPTWLVNDGISQWVSPQPTYTEGMSDAEGYWSFQTSFVLGANANPSTASITGRMLGDNQVVDIYINDVPYVPQQASTLNDFQNWASFSLSGSSGLFATGTNTLTFIVQNADAGPGGPTALRVEFGPSAVEDIPEPATFGLLGAGLLALGLFHRRKRA